MRSVPTRSRPLAAGFFLGAWALSGFAPLRRWRPGGGARSRRLRPLPALRALPIACFFVALCAYPLARCGAWCPTLAPTTMSESSPLSRSSMHDSVQTMHRRVRAHFGVRGSPGRRCRGAGRRHLFVSTSFTHKYLALALLIALLLLRLRPAAAVLPAPRPAADRAAGRPAHVGVLGRTRRRTSRCSRCTCSPRPRRSSRRGCSPSSGCRPPSRRLPLDALSSANRRVRQRQGNGFFPALVVGRACCSDFRSAERRVVRLTIQTSPPAVAVVAIGVALQYLSVPATPASDTCPALVKQRGPYAGIHTTSEKRKLLVALDDLAGVRAQLPDRLLRHVSRRISPRPSSSATDPLALRRRGRSRRTRPSAAVAAARRDGGWPARPAPLQPDRYR